MTKVLNSSNYTICGWMLNDLNLKGVALNVYAIIYGFSQDGESEYFGSRQYLADFIGVSRPTIDKALNELIDKGFIFKVSQKINEITFNRYKANISCLNFTGCKETLLGGVKKLDRDTCKETLHNNKDILDIYNNKYIYIVDFLNEKADTKYKSATPKTKTLIKARLSEGFDVKDFEQVISNMCAEWKGTEMEKYLRPETLFGTKFESYLNRVVKKSQNGYSREELENIANRCGVYV